jgi:hypothetical protein
MSRVAVLILLCLVPGCREADRQAPARDDGPPALSEREIERGRAACDQYRARVCACAEAEESLAGDCRLAESRIEGLAMQLRILGAAGDLASTERRVVQAEARKIILGCFEATAELGTRCPAE